MEDLPTSKTVGVFIGLVELKGTAESEAPLLGLLSEQPCVWYSWNVLEHWSKIVTETSHDKDGKLQTRTRTESGWTTIASGGESKPFYLQDDLGVIRINPEHAEIKSKTVFNRNCSMSDPLYYGKGPTNTIAHSTGKRSFTEQAILLHQTVYVVGQSRERLDCVAAEIAYDRSSPIFLISTLTEEKHRSYGLVMFWLLGLLAVFLPVVVGFIAQFNQVDFPDFFVLALGTGGCALLIWGIGWFWLIYNSLIGLKNRVKSAAANIDVELKRRHDLIPQLIGTVEGLQRHEHDLQETLVVLRSQIDVQSVAGGNTANGCMNRIVAIVENYPDIRANELFMKLQSYLVEAEQRIALARTYYNDMVETHNNRRERFPECLIAVLAGLRVVPRFEAENFERSAVKVNLVQQVSNQ